MDESIAIEMLRVAFDLADEETKPEKALGHYWTSDPEKQQQDIETLSYFVASSQTSHQTKVWAYNKIAELAKEYWKSGNLDDAPRALTLWSLGVASGEIRSPKKTRGRVVHDNVARNHMIVEMIGWLRQEGETKDRAIRLVAKAVENRMKINKPRASFGPDAVKTVLKDQMKKK